ncbi:LacI family DNA-binding transcriptional regulator [Clostridium sp. E02]|uniref:LacI family DNA-binding transcriptional regulator n=1 Tax=Clostridium sp. E02 TaxID=2487134 RepID=UPI000F523739|nr:LacI family DNA-binding transcriptional regulator [Clostridium sp. E02]
MSITAKDLAKLLNLSEAAISMALNHKPGVSTQTRKKVIESAKKYNYDFSRIKENSVSTTPHGMIQFIIYKKNGAVVSDTPFFSQLSEGIDAGCKEACYYLNISYLYEEDDIPSKVADMVRLGCRGILLLGTEMAEEDIKPFLNLPIPVVVVDTYFESQSTDCVVIDNVQGAFFAANYLIRKRKNQPGYLKSSYPIKNFEQRSDGFYQAVKKNGMSISNTKVHKLSPSMDGAYADMAAILKQGELPADCYFADNDLIAAGAIKALKENGYLIPKDVAVVGFDNMPLCTFLDPPLTTIHVPKQYMGMMAARRMAELIQETASYPIKIEISTTLVHRKST